MRSFFASNARRLLYALCFIITLGVIYAVDYALIVSGHAPSDETIWYLIRSSGIVAYLLLTAATAWGILLSSKIVKEWIPAPVALELHNYLSWTALGLTLYHAFLLLFSSFFNYRWVDLLLPFSGPYEPFWVGLGILSMYVMALASLTFYLSKQIGYATFRKIHYLTYGVFGMALLHSWMAGSDTLALQWVYLGSALLVLFLTFYRILSARSTPATAQSNLHPYTLIRQ